VSTGTAIAETTPSPPMRTVPQQTVHSNASPTAGESHDHWRPPQSATAACPIDSEATHTANPAA
jgi:hypothetical protein